MRRVVQALFLLTLATSALIAAGVGGATPQVASPIKGSFKYCNDPTFPPMESKTTGGVGSPPGPFRFQITTACCD